MLCTERTAAPPSTTWADLHWHTVEGHGGRRQERLDRAATHPAWRTGKNRQKLLVRATSNQLLALRRITQANQGTHTAGMDGRVSATPEARGQLLQEGLRRKGDKPRPVRRGSIPKDNGTHRPVGIPPGKDRVRPAIVTAAREPAWEARCEANADGFRPGRCTLEAVEAIHTTTHRHNGRPGGLAAAMSGGLANLDHAPLWAKLPACTTTLRQGLQAGVIAVGCGSPPDPGTPPGGVIAPLVAHVALEGMARLFDAAYAAGRPKAPARRTGHNTGRAVMRSADDGVTTAPTREVVAT